MTRIYLDHAATTPLRPEAREAMLRGFDIWANPSSPHAEGREARAALEDARERVKAALGWEGECIFTSGASEALALAVSHSAVPLKAVSAVEHDALLRLAGDAVRLNVDAGGLVSPEDCAHGGLVAIQHANSETGVIQPLDEISAAVRDTGGMLLSDCAQTAGKIEVPAADLVVVSAHKFGGPIGIGALLVRDLALLRPSGGQERGYRGGTENLPGAMAMAAILEAPSQTISSASWLRERLDKLIVENGGEIVAQDSPRIPTISSYRMPGKPARAQLIEFDGKGIAVSAGSACSSGTLKASHVLAAMGCGGADEVIRVSFGHGTDEAAVSMFFDAWLAMARAAAERAA
jgi:cysteine desulfurase